MCSELQQKFEEHIAKKSQAGPLRRSAAVMQAKQTTLQSDHVGICHGRCRCSRVRLVRGDWCLFAQVTMNPDGVYAFIELRSADMTDLALQLDGQILHGRPMAVGRPVAKPDFRQPMAVGRPVAKPDFRRMLLSAEDALGAARLLVKEFPGSPTPDLGEQFQAITGVGFQVRRTPSRWWARTGSDVGKSQRSWGRISAQMWGESRRRWGRVPAQMWGESRRRWGRVPAQMWGRISAQLSDADRSP